MQSITYKRDKFRAKFCGKKVINLDKRYKQSDSSDYFSDEGSKSDTKSQKSKRKVILDEESIVE
jgi:hypothetical protein